MRLTKLDHACVTLEKDGAVIAIDPGTFGNAAPVLWRADAVLVTHEHTDHFDEAAIQAALAARPELTLWASSGVAARFPRFPRQQVREVSHGQALEIAGFTVHVYGTVHALVHPEIPLVSNTGFLIEGEVFHPGDSFTVPDDPAPTLLVPVSGPWLKAGEIIDYFRAVAPARGYIIHDAILNQAGLDLMGSIVTSAAAPGGSQAARLAVGDSVDLR